MINYHQKLKTSNPGIKIKIELDSNIKIEITMNVNSH